MIFAMGFAKLNHDPDVATTVELFPTDKGVRMVLTFDAMHDEEWTQRAKMGWKSELGKLAKVLDARPDSRARAFRRSKHQCPLAHGEVDVLADAPARIVQLVQRLSRGLLTQDRHRRRDRGID
jgi:hypothetical protein